MKRNPITREKLSSIDIWWNNREEIKDKKRMNHLRRLGNHSVYL